jgi:hypothetical protein
MLENYKNPFSPPKVSIYIVGKKIKCYGTTFTPGLE